MHSFDLWILMNEWWIWERTRWVHDNPMLQFQHKAVPEFAIAVHYMHAVSAFHYYSTSIACVHTRQLGLHTDTFVTTFAMQAHRRPSWTCLRCWPLPLQVQKISQQCPRQSVARFESWFELPHFLHNDQLSTEIIEYFHAANEDNLYKKVGLRDRQICHPR